MLSTFASLCSRVQANWRDHGFEQGPRDGRSHALQKAAARQVPFLVHLINRRFQEKAAAQGRQGKSRVADKSPESPIDSVHQLLEVFSVGAKNSGVGVRKTDCR